MFLGHSVVCEFVPEEMSNTSIKVLKGTVVSSKKKDEGVFDLEQQYLLRLPPGPAIAMRRDVQAAAMNLKNRLSIELQHDMRHGKVTYGGQVFNAKLKDLPCVVEALKTTDRKSFYKTADICQILTCNTDDDSDSHDERESPKKKDKEKEKKHQWNHGITPSLKNVRKKRFRKPLKKKYQEQPDIEKEVKRLFRMDNEAIDVKWEVVIEDDQTNNPDNPEKQVLAHGGITPGIGGDDMPGTSSLLGYGIDENDIFGELSSSDEEDEKDINVMDSGDEENAGALANMDQMATGLLTMSDSNMSADGGEAERELQIKLVELVKQLDDIRERRMAQELELAVMSEEDAKGPIHARLNEMLEEEGKKQNEFEILSSMLNQS